MGRIGKTFALFLSLIIVMSSLTLLTVKPTNAQTMPKPTIPEFTLSVESHPYDTAPTTTVDPYTGKTITTEYGYNVDNKSITITIRNQPFTTYQDSGGNNVSLMYNIRWKGHFGNDTWTYFAGQANNQEFTRDYFRPSSEDYSAWVATLSRVEWDKRAGDYNYFISVPDDGQIDFQAEALIGVSTKVYLGNSIPFGATYYYNFTGQTSGWSNTQTINLADGSVSSSTPNPSPTVPEFPLVSVLSLLAVIPLITILAKKRICLKAYN
jgi:hypothetical protein